MERLTIEQIEAIRDRVEKATEGPWRITDNGKIVGGMFVGEIDDVFYKDAEFIANARQDIPSLLAEVDRLNAILESLYVEGILSREVDEDGEEI